jgi:Na+-driven multidrug efflux pump
MAKKLIFTLLWSGGVFCLLVIPMTFMAPFILKWLGPVDEHTSTGVKLAYTLLPLAILAVPGVLLFLGLLGKLPGTKMDAHSK